MSKLEVDKIDPQSGTALEIGSSGDTITIPSGATLDASNATTTLPANVVTTDGTQTLTNKTIDASQLTGTITPSDGTVTNAKVNASAAIDYSKLNLTGNIALADLSATGTKDATTFLRGDNTFTVPGGGDYVKLSSGTTGSVSQLLFANSVFDSDYSTHIIELNLTSSSNTDSGYVDMFYDDAATFSSGFTNCTSISLQMNSSNASPEMSGGEEDNGVMRIATDGWRSNAGPQPIIIECHNMRTDDVKYFYWRALHLNMDANQRLIVNYGGGCARTVSTTSSLKFASQNGWNFGETKYAVYGVK